MLYFIQLPVYLLQDCQSKTSIYQKNREFTDIDSYENINLLKNDSNFETLHFPKCLH